MVRLGGVGIWTAQLDFQAAPQVIRSARLLESLGYDTLWIGENVGREPFTQAGLLLANTSRIKIATGVANIWARDALATATAQFTLAEAYPGRFILGIGTSHAHLVNNVRGHSYHQPLTTMRDYLDAMEAARNRYRAHRPSHSPLVLAALGPRMLELAAQRCDGAHTYLVPPEHTAQARRILGTEPWLVPEQAVVLDADPTRARHIARQHIRRYLPLDNYTNNLRRLGFTQADFINDGSDRLVDAIVAWGDLATISRRIRDHYSAGADQVCIQVLDADFQGLPLTQWQELAALVADTS